MYFTQGIAVVSGSALNIFLYMVNSNVIFTFGYQFESNGTLITQCFSTIPSTKWMEIWNNVHSFMYSFIPFTLLAIINIFLIIDLQQKKRAITTTTSRIHKNQLSINFSVIIMTLLFIAFTSPGAVCSQFYNTLVQSDNGLVILYASDCVAFSYHALNIIILCVSNKQFFRKLKVSLGVIPETTTAYQSRSIFS